MSEIQRLTGLSEAEANESLAAFIASRDGQDWTSDADGVFLTNQIGETLEWLKWFTRSLDSIALITAAMTQPERWEYVDKLSWLKSEEASSLSFVALADAPTRAIAAILALGLQKEIL